MFLLSGIAIAAEIISLTAMLAFIFSTTLKNRKKFILAQTLFLVLDGIVWLLKSGFSALIQDLIGIARNVCIYFNKQTKILDNIFIVLAVVLGLVVIDWKNFKFYELFPIIANLEFTIALLKSKKIKYIKIALIISSSLWATYALFTHIYVTFAFNILSFITAVISLITILKKERQNNGVSEESD